MELRTINQRIKHIARSAASMNAYVQDTAVGVLVHAQETGDCTAALRLVQALPKSYRRGLLIQFFATYSPIGMNVTNNKVGFHRPDAKAYNAFNIEGARANPWYEGAAADAENLPDTTIEDVRKGLFALARRLQGKLDRGEVANDNREAVARSVAAITELAKAA